MERQLPKNVRQIGNVSDSSKIYVEDYVDTFFNQLCEKAEAEPIGAFLVGEKIQEGEQDYIYVYGAIRMKELRVKGKDFAVDEPVWKDACETCKKYFGNAEILGWFIAGGEQSLVVNHNITKIHQKYFSRDKSLFVTKNARDQEEKFYLYQYRDLLECNGHYVYYEKNLEMQNYMISTRKRVGLTPGEIIEDRVTKNFRNIIREKTQLNEQKNRSRMVYTLSTFLVLVILVIGVTMINNYEKIKNVGNEIDILADEQEQDENELAVETLGEIVDSQTEETVPPQETQTENNDVTQDPQNPQDEQVIPPSEETSSDKTTEDTAILQTQEYIVKKGDTLESISKEKYGTVSNIEVICKLNGLQDGNLIYVGQKLLLP